MKKILKKYWYLLLILLFIPLYFVFNMKEEEIVETLAKEEVEIKEEVKAEVKEDDDEKIVEEKILKKKFAEIKGEVKRPGVYEISDDTRVVDIIKIAGGLTKNADTSILNLSKKVTDEMSIKIYSKEEIKNALDSIEPKTIEVIKEVEKVVEKECNCNDVCVKTDAYIENKADDINKVINEEINDNNNEELNIEKKDTKININNASKEELMTIPGIGESKAIKIIEYRSNNKFNNIEDIKNVSGIGESLFEKIKEYIAI